MKEVYDKWFKDNGYKFLNSGLIHNVYEKNNYIYKIVKSNIKYLNNREHFEKEKRCMEYLNKKGFNIVKIEKIFNKNELVKDFCVLKEPKLEGKCYTENNIPNECILSILKFIKSVSNISLKEYGIIFDKNNKSDSSWQEYINKQLRIAIKIINKYFQKFDILKKELLSFSINYVMNVDSRFLIMDPNPENFFFTKDGMIAIDIDHPIGGDPLWQTACFYWYKEKWISELYALDFVNCRNYKFMLIYCLIFGLNTFEFFEKNSILIDSWNFKRIERLGEEINCGKIYWKDNK